jgi:hypothetical protein
MDIQEGPIVNEFLEANLLSGLGKWQSIIFQGAVTPKLLRFLMVNEDSEKKLFLAAVICKEEKIMWQSFQDLLEQSTKLALTGLQGIFGLDVLSADIQEGTRHFNIQDFSALLINHGRKLKLGEQKHIRYGQIFSILHKRAPADWGKIDVDYHVEIVNPEKTPFERFMKNVMRQSGEGNHIYLIHDLGINPVWNLEHEEFPASVYFYQSAGSHG